MPDQTTLSKAPELLVEGERLDQQAFHALYETMPSGTKAELIDGVVYVPVPAGVEHGAAIFPVIAWLSYYAENTPGVEGLDNATTILGPRSEPQPDVLLRIRPECGGRTWNEDGYLHGAPELVVEVAKATRYVDLEPKLNEYERAGVLEYIVRTFDPDEIYWFGQEGGALVRRPIGEDGMYHLTAFPGLWLDPVALLEGDARRLRSVVALGCAAPEHAAVVARLAAQR